MPTTYAIPNGRTVMNAITYSGTSATHTITNSDNGTAGFKPDLIWAKSRTNPSSGYLNILSDSVRGQTSGYYNNLYSDSSYSQNVSGTVLPAVQGGITTLNSNGFTLANGSAPAYWQNESGYTYVAWQWQAGQGTNTTNTDGYVTSTVSVNQTAGFSIITWTGNGAATTIGHGLGAAPQFLLHKSKSIANDWLVYHQSMGNTSFMYLDLQTGSQSSSAAWNNTSPTSTVFTVGTNTVINTNGSQNVTYAWTPIAGFSQFGSYAGNGSTDGPFVYTGFRPKFILIKNTGTIGGYGDWSIIDTSRNTYNAANTQLRANTNDSENTNTAYNVDLLSNGFKLRTAYNDFNASGYTYIYAVFAENPFKYANAR